MSRPVAFLLGVAFVIVAVIALSQIGPDDSGSASSDRMAIFAMFCFAVGLGFFLKAWLDQSRADEDVEDHLAQIPFADGSLPDRNAQKSSAADVASMSDQPSRTTHPIVSALVYTVLFIVSMGLMTALLAQNGRNLFAPEMRIMLFASIAAAGYVAWRIGRIVAKRLDFFGMTRMSGVVPGVGPLSGMSAFRGKSSGSAATRARRARVEARRRKLQAEGKLDDAAPPDPDTAPARVAKTAPIQDRMAARAERVRRAKEQGKLD